MSKNERIMILDGNNNFLRNYVVNPNLAKDGSPNGGVKGFLKSLQKLCKEVQPDMIISAWDGAGGSRKRKAMVEDYKAGRKPLRLNRNVPQNLSPQEETENRQWQFVRLIDYLNDMPVIQFLIDEIEADDIIACLVQLESLKGKTKIIVSADKDFYQLCDNETIVMRPIQDQIINRKRILSSFNIHPNNFALARAMVGDSSDNLVGIKGAGLATVAKRFPFLAEEKFYTLDEVCDYCKKTDQKIKLYENVLKGRDIVDLNYRMMQLYSPIISGQNIGFIKKTLEDFVPTFNKTEVLKKMLEDDFVDYNWDALFQIYKRIVFSHNRS